MGPEFVLDERVTVRDGEDAGRSGVIVNLRKDRYHTWADIWFDGTPCPFMITARQIIPWFNIRNLKRETPIEGGQNGTGSE